MTAVAPPNGEDAEVARVRRILAAWVPTWAGTSIVPVPATRTDRRLFRLGVAPLVLILPRSPAAARALRRETRWLWYLKPMRFLYPHRPLDGPHGRAAITAAERVWLPGADAWAAPPSDGASEAALARDLGGFVAALRARPVPPDAPGPSPGPSGRGGPVAALDGAVRAALASMRPEERPAEAAAAWPACRALPPHDGPPAWFHGDLHPFNLIMRDGRLAAVVDWELLGTGDPACDLAAGWQVFDGPRARATFREAAGADDELWARGRAWALAKAVEAIPFHRDRNPAFAAFARRTLARVLADP